MADRISAMKVGSTLAVILVCSIGVAAATWTVGIGGSSGPAERATRSTAAVSSLAESVTSTPAIHDFIREPSRGARLAGGFADVAAMVRPAVVGVRARRLEAGRDGSPTEYRNRPRDSFDNPNGALMLPPPHRARRVVSMGSGFFISPDGYAVTNNHVTEGCETVEIMTDDQKTYTARVVAADPTSDLALLKVDGPADFSFVKLAEKVPRVGDWIFAIGNPFGLNGTVTAGIVSARHRKLGTHSDEDLIQVDASINRGNSGGPSFDLDGNVIGVNTMIISPSGGSIGIGFAIPAKTVEFVVSQLRAKGAVTRGSIAAQTQSLTPAIADLFGLPGTQGALVAEAQTDGPAMRAGIVPGDVIASINGEAVKDNHDLIWKIATKAPGTLIMLGVVHNGDRRTVDVVLGELPPAPERSATVARAASLPRQAELGLRMAPAGGLAGADRNGVTVTGVDPSGLAGDIGLEAGDVILDVSGHAVHTPDEVHVALSEVRNAGRSTALIRIKSHESVRFVAIPVGSA
jgi:serine protease Do